MDTDGHENVNENENGAARVRDVNQCVLRRFPVHVLVLVHVPVRYRSG